jgi:uncharacterized protein (UPF0303 family)
MLELTLSGLADQQQLLLLKRFDYEFAWQLGSLIRKRAAAAGAPIAIQIRHGDDVVFAALLPGATIDNFDWARRKCAVAHRFHRSSLAMRLESEVKGYDFNTRFRLPAADYAASGGGVPLMLASGTLVGTVGVSGLPDTEDHSIITSAIADLLGASE